MLSVPYAPSRRLRWVASMGLLARIEAVDARGSTLVGDSTVAMSGRAATFGGRMMNSVADQVLKQFDWLRGWFARKKA